MNKEVNWEMSELGCVVVKSMYQFGWAMVPRFLVKHSSECWFKRVFSMRFTFK